MMPAIVTGPPSGRHTRADGGDCCRSRFGTRCGDPAMPNWRRAFGPPLGARGGLSCSLGLRERLPHARLSRDRAHGGGVNRHGRRVRDEAASAVWPAPPALPCFGDAVPVREGELPVFWACGVTPQSIAMAAKPPLMITHSPGCMFVTDIKEETLAAG
ncbi:MAG: DUF1445 domain-containing protein [Planctomycetales bacterium]